MVIIIPILDKENGGIDSSDLLKIMPTEMRLELRSMGVNHCTMLLSSS